MEYNGADSRCQREIEKIIVDKIALEENKEFTKKATIESVNFEFDFYYGKGKKIIIGEIYAGIDKINAGSRKKVITDCFKMVYAEKLLGYPCEKRLIFIDEKIKKVFIGDSWIAKAINAYKIDVKVIEISIEEMNKLRVTKKLQQLCNQKK